MVTPVDDMMDPEKMESENAGQHDSSSHHATAGDSGSRTGTIRTKGPVGEKSHSRIRRSDIGNHQIQGDHGQS